MYDATVRDTAHAILLDAATIAGKRVTREWGDNPQDTDMPRLAVMVDSSGQSRSEAGGSPVFDVVGDLLILAQIGEAKEADAINNLDLLTGQARDALLCSIPLQQLATLRSWRIGRSFKASGRLIIGEARIVLTMTWRETVTPSIAALPVFTGADLRTNQGPSIGADVNT